MTNQPFRSATIDLAAIRNNVGVVKKLVGETEVMAVVKANGYGHGAVEVARAALEAGATWLGVADVDEALALRSAGLQAPILAWLHDPTASFDAAVRNGIDVGVSSVAQLEAVAVAADALNRAGRVHIKVDTGLGRNGAEPSAWRAVFERAAELQGEGRLEVVGLFSHLSNANDDEDRAQLQQFDEAVDLAASVGVVPPIIHLAATAATFRLPETRLSMVRLGIGMYGLSPFDDVTSAELGLIPAMRLEGRVIAVKRVPADSAVSYGYTYRTAGASTLALVGLGYADGIPRLGSNRAPVLINGQRYRVSGRIAMDQFVADVHDGEVAVGDQVVLFGDPAAGHPAVEEWAEAAETINYEVVTRIGQRFKRRYTS
ncbi:alanine racemase [Subtercola endophyticus]|uniref:alanine racemase n=1 Tax=Subtercola endophyticus TaxID=2895559 RepID=UPI001E5E25D3|nr:alanine racemase [Subtercola endophyticus]UFS59363.1 alanine racemase [Subtercola endophyticus]